MTSGYAVVGLEVVARVGVDEEGGCWLPVLVLTVEAGDCGHGGEDDDDDDDDDDGDDVMDDVIDDGDGDDDDDDDADGDSGVGRAGGDEDGGVRVGDLDGDDGEKVRVVMGVEISLSGGGGGGGWCRRGREEGPGQLRTRMRSDSPVTREVGGWG